MVICPVCGRRREVRVWPLMCSCGVLLQESGEWVQTPQRRREERQTHQRRQTRDDQQIAALVLICSSCDYFRPHEIAGGRCTHKRCGCGRGTEPVEIGGVRINAGLVDVMRRGGKCPLGLW